jgi:hypothetical protein
MDDIRRDDAARTEMGFLLDQEVRRLPRRYRDAVVLCGLEGRSLTAVADELSWNRQVVRRRLFRGVKLLRSRLAEQGMEFTFPSLVQWLKLDSRSGALPDPLVRVVTRLAVQGKRQGR